MIQGPHVAFFMSLSFISISILEHKGKMGRKAMKGGQDSEQAVIWRALWHAKGKATPVKTLPVLNAVLGA
jgi:hypothetical protein